MNNQNELQTLIEELKSEIYRVYEGLHALAEPSAKEYKTSAYISNILVQNGINHERGVAETGIVAILDSGVPGPTLGIRADLDGLIHSVDGKEKVMHTCGHDAHSTMVLFAGILLKEQNLLKKGRVKLIFQPSEEDERTSGARRMAKEGVVDDIDCLVGIHLRPIEEASFGQGIAALKHGALTTIGARITGESAHGGRPHLGKNPIDAMAAIVNSINAQWIDPKIPSSAKVTYINAGTIGASSIPPEGTIVVDLRCQNNEEMEILIKKVTRAIETGAETVDCKAEIKVIPGLPAAVYDDGMIQMADSVLRRVLGDGASLGIIQTTGAEDFHEFTKHKPSLRTTYIGLGADLFPGLHHPDMTFRREALLKGIEILVRMAEEVLI